MENTCRLCLNECPETVEVLSEGCDVLEKLSTSLSHSISLTKGLPNKICSSCIKKVDEIYTFHTDISQNELILQQKLKIVNHDKILNEIKEENEIYHDNESVDTIDIPYIKDKLNVLDVNAKPELLESKNINNDNECSNNSNNIHSKLFRNKEQIQCNQHGYDDIPLKILKENKNLNSGLTIDVPTKFMCLTCFEVFPNQLELLRHYRTVELEKYNKINGDINNELESVKYKCYQSDDGTLGYKCDRCYKKYKHKRFIERHIKSHIERRPFLCKLCGKTYQTASIIVAHGKMHAGQLYTCSYNCGYKSVHKHVVKEHEKRHRKEYKFKCETCGKGFQVRPLFEQHQNIHQGIKPFSCDICGTTFHMHKYLMTHRSNVHPQTSSRKPWVCKQCSLPCDSKNSLNIHMKDKHGIIVKVSILCDICGKVLRDTQQLKYHKRAVHLNIKPYTCSVCSKSFPKKFTLKVHEQIHMGKLYSCDICDKKYSRKCTLERHLKRFHMDLKFKCQKCEKTFSSNVKLTAHERYCPEDIDVKTTS